MALDPELAPILESAPEVSYRDLGVDEARKLMIISSQGLSTPVELESVTDTVATLQGRDLPLRVYAPPGRTGAGLVYFHGGGWVLGSIITHDAYCRALAAAADVTLISVDYRLAPEHPFPAAANDAIDAARWIMQRAGGVAGATDDAADEAFRELNPHRIGVGGDSAGGNLAAIASQALRHETHRPACQLLIYPIVDCENDTESYQDNAEGYLLTKAAMDWFWETYCPNPANRQDLLASPLRNRDLRELAPAFVMTAEYDPLRDEGETYARRLADSGNDVQLKRYPGMIHGFVRRLRALKAARTSLADVASFLREKLGA